MKIAIRGGHNFQAPGASGIISETVEDRKVKDAVIKYLKQRGISVLDVTPGRMPQKEDLAYSINKAKEWGADMFFSIHFNNAYSNYSGAIGTEVILKQGSPMLSTAKRVNNKLVDLGFKRHGNGIAYNQHLYELNHFNSAMIVEVCFVEATTDVATYRNLGPDAIGKAIVGGLLDVKIGDSPAPINTQSTSCSLDGRKGIISTSSSNLNVRSQPNSSSTKIGSLPKGTTVKIFKDCGNGWYEIYFGKHGGFVSKDYMKLI
ncbi:SH3 domain-containing protein [Clostridium botulinum C/D]|uniref:N-acetylmuramoyl-L-alanine amidase n=1 Tax=Clostridium botulinum TaxID=1491 RepID=UPI0002DACE11|nr:N-acetylmuramoyl-L-alanine amidase [Clostridium botulinum]KEI02880.1 hypothetical protein Y848_06305 [Clostridium botulinum C/D str. Sp77]KOA76886.1 hypothetical protein ADU78_05365 [Clostridium botulinum]KOA80931.1 hypothetical protein ADU77_00095 [Clostridium botulinum]KOA88957.1 hypothetical protein ADU75_00825 [Clostridium botulinum]KOC31860.1 hypothetical protein ADU83_12090 [Clostridium botulinum]